MVRIRGKTACKTGLRRYISLGFNRKKKEVRTMKKLVLFAVLLGAGMVSAFDLNSAESGIQLSSQPGARPAAEPAILLQRADRPVRGVVEITASKELVFRPEPGKSEAEMGVYLPLPARVSRVRIAFELRADAFFVSRKIREFSYFNFYIGGVNLMLRGNAYGLRYYDVARKTYVHGIPFVNGEWRKIVIDMNCGAKPVYALNDFRDIPQRGQCEYINRLTFYGKFVNAAAQTAVRIRNLTVELPED